MRTLSILYQHSKQSLSLEKVGKQLSKTIATSLIIWSAITLLLHSNAYAQSWTKTYGGTKDDRGYSVQQTSDGGFVIVGSTKSFGAGGEDVYLIKTDSSGASLWTKTYGGTKDDRGYSVQQTSDGGFIIAGSTKSFGTGWSAVYLIRTNSSGDTLWTKTYGGIDEDEAHSVQQTADDGFIIAGYTWSFGAGWADVYLIKTDSSGASLWTKTYGGPKNDVSYSVQQTSDDGFIVAGTTRSFGAGWSSICLIKTNSSGDTIWTKIHGGYNGDYGYSVQQTSDDGFIIAGSTESFGDGGASVYLIKTNSSGDTLWTKTYGRTCWDEGYSVQQTSDDGFIIAGYTESFGAGMSDVYIIRTNPSGATLWTKTYGGTENDAGYSVQQTSDRGFVIVGYTNSFGTDSSDVYLIKTDSSGEIGIVEDSSTLVSPELELLQNPVTNFVTIRYSLLSSTTASINIYNLSGRLVQTLPIPHDSHTMKLNLKNSDNKPLSSGIYFLTLTAGDYKLTRKLTLLK